MTLALQDDHERQVCPECGMAFTDQRQHTDWHVEQRVKRLQPEPDPEARFMLSLLTDALNRLDAKTVRQWERDEAAARIHAARLRQLHAELAPAPDAAERERERAGEGTL